MTTYNEAQDIERTSLVHECQVGAIILYTYVFHMLAPPPEGTFDIEDGNLPLKSPAKDAPPKDAAPEQVPLLTQEDDKPIDSNAPKQGKVRMNVYVECVFIQFYVIWLPLFYPVDC